MAEFEFAAPKLSDREWAEKKLAESDFRGCIYTFGNNYVWRNVYNVKICSRNGFYLVMNRDAATNIPRFLYPAGSGDIKPLIAELKDYCRGLGVPLIMSANRKCTEQLKELFPDIEVTADRDGFDYVYNADELALLKGKKYHGKRNHLNRFYENEWSFEPISEGNIPYCREILEKWLENDPENREKQEEAAVVRESLDLFRELCYTGGFLTANGKPQAFAFGEPSARDTFVVHVEKALLDVPGSYAAINCEFAKVIAENYRYINREEDTGSEGLRQAKLSYHPVFMEEKYMICFN